MRTREKNIPSFPNPWTGSPVLADFFFIWKGDACSCLSFLEALFFLLKWSISVGNGSVMHGQITKCLFYESLFFLVQNHRLIFLTVDKLTQRFFHRISWNVWGVVQKLHNKTAIWGRKFIETSQAVFLRCSSKNALPAKNNACDPR